MSNCDALTAALADNARLTAELEQAKAANAKLLKRLDIEQAEHIAIEGAKAAPPASAQRGGWERSALKAALIRFVDITDFSFERARMADDIIKSMDAYLAARGAGLGG